MKLFFTLFPITLCLIIGLSASDALYAGNQGSPPFVPDQMPNAIRVLLDDFRLCNQRNERRDNEHKLICDPDKPKLDPDTYTMDEYVRGILGWVEATPRGDSSALAQADN